MPLQVCMGAQMMCSFGMAPSSLVVLPVNRVNTDMVPDANIMDYVPMDEHHALRHVHHAVESRGCVGYRRGLGSVDADALHPGHHLTLDAGRCDRQSGLLSDARQYLDVDVHLGRSHHLCGRRRRDRKRALIVAQTVEYA